MLSVAHADDAFPEGCWFLGLPARVPSDAADALLDLMAPEGLPMLTTLSPKSLQGRNFTVLSPHSELLRLAGDLASDMQQ